MRERFIPHNFQAKSLLRIQQANELLEYYAARGLRITLRGLYYRLVANNYIPNKVEEYDKLGETLTNARLAGLVDWHALEDIGRLTKANAHWRSAQEAVADAEASFALRKWEPQPWHVELMVEKAAQEAIIRPVCHRHDIPFTANRGYSSSSALYDTGRALRSYMESGKDICVLYLGDHDPSGLDMTRDIEDRIRLFAGKSVWNDADQCYDENPEFADRRFIVERLALNMDQIQQYKLPPNPTKLKDSRAPKYVAEFGYDSYEMDAMPPEVIEELIPLAVDRYKDKDLWQIELAKEDAMRSIIGQLARSTARQVQGQGGYGLSVGFGIGVVDMRRTFYYMLDHSGEHCGYLAEGHIEREAFRRGVLVGFQDDDALEVDQVYGYWSHSPVSMFEDRFIRVAPSDPRAEPFTVGEFENP